MPCRGGVYLGARDPGRFGWVRLGVTAGLRHLPPQRLVRPLGPSDWSLRKVVDTARWAAPTGFVGCKGRLGTVAESWATVRFIDRSHRRGPHACDAPGDVPGEPASIAVTFVSTVQQDQSHRRTPTLSRRPKAGFADPVNRPLAILDVVSRPEEGPGRSIFAVPRVCARITPPTCSDASSDHRQ